MQSNDAYIILSSDNSLNTQTQNNVFSFTVDLPQTIAVNGICALQNISFTPAMNLSENIYVYSDICTESLTNGKYMRILRMVSKSGDQSQLIFHKLSQNNFNSVTINIRLANSDIPSFRVEQCTCALLLRNIK